MRLLFVSPYVPSPVRVRPYQWIRALARQGVRVRLIALRPPEDAWVHEPAVADACERMTVFPLTRMRTLANAASAMPRGLPLQAAYSLHPDAERQIAGEARECDVVHIEHLRGALLARRVRGVPCVIDAVDSIASLFAQAAAQAPSWRQRWLARAELAPTRRFEATFPRRFARCVVSSARDAEAFRSLSGDDGTRVTAISNGVDLDYFRPSPVARAGEHVLFTGKLSYHANEAAAIQLATRIMPLVWRERPQARLVLAGKDPSAALRRLARDPRIVVTGYVEDLRPCFWSSTVMVAPIVYGAGIQNKVLEAMACQVPVVASRTACAGLEPASARALLAADDVAEFAAQTVWLLSNPALRDEVGRAGRLYVERYHDWNRLVSRLIDVYEDVRAAPRRCA
jgi:glycosyltransferase involved in cell wall biosynthesis